MIAVAITIIGLAVVAISVFCAGSHLRATYRLRRLYKGRLRTLTPTVAKLEFAAIQDDAIELIATQVSVTGFPTQSEYEKMSISHRTLYRSRLEDRIRTTGIVKSTIITLATIFLSILAGYAISDYTMVLAPFQSGGSDLYPEAAIRISVYGLVFTGLAATPGFATVFSRIRKQEAGRLLASYEHVGRFSG